MVEHGATAQLMGVGVKVGAAAPLAFAWLMLQAGQIDATLPGTWQDVAARYGITGVLLLAGGWFFINKYWPDYLDHRNKMEAAEVERERVLNARYDGLVSTVTDMARTNAEALKSASDALKAVAAMGVKP